jgi:2-iminoacetate synthase ThiH
MPAHARAWRGYACLVDAALRATGVHPVERQEVASVETLKRMAEAGIAVVPGEGL